MGGDTSMERPFEDVIDFREGPGILARDFRDDGIPLVRLSGLNRGGSVLEGCSYVDPLDVERRWPHFRLALGDVLLSTSASLGRIAVVSQEGVGAIPYTGIIRMRPRDDSLHAPFIRYLLEGPDFQQQAEMVGSGSVIRHFGPMHLKQMTVRIPPLPEQRAIAHILGTLDDKIELNRRMNETLEEMARALFMSWFVNFDPLRAKMEGRWRPGESLPGLPAEYYDLFPNRLADSELGEIPEGWEVKALGDVCEKPQYGFTASAKGDPVGPKFLRITDINKVPWIDWTTVPYCEASEGVVKKYRLSSGDILIARMADPGHGAVIEENQSAVFASYLIRFRPLKDYHSRIIQYWLKSDSYWDLVYSRGAGTTRISLNAKVLSEFSLVIPPTSLSTRFSAKINSIRSRVVANLADSATLAALRDVLLPKLVSGETRVGNTQRQTDSDI